MGKRTEVKFYRNANNITHFGLKYFKVQKTSYPRLLDPEEISILSTILHKVEQAKSISIAHVPSKVLCTH